MSGANSGSASDDNTNFMQFMSLGSQDFLAARVSGCENDIAPASETKEVQELKKKTKHVVGGLEHQFYFPIYWE